MVPAEYIAIIENQVDKLVTKQARHSLELKIFILNMPEIFLWVLENLDSGSPDQAR